MITSVVAKPWIAIESNIDVHGGEPSSAAKDQADLLKQLLERGFPVTSFRRDGKGIPAESNQRRFVLARKKTEMGEESLAPESADPSVTTIDISSLGLPEIVARVEDQHASISEGVKSKKWKPWFPVIDYDRCTNCMQCLSFCLFDVYGVTTDKKITVQNEDNCKTDCPACSRVCPEVAIMFPKYKAGPINGDVVSSDDVRREGMKVDISSLLGGDIYAMLKDRSAKAKSRFSAERDEDRALKERKRCLDKLKSLMGDLEIPADLLASLPSSDQIQSRAESAKKKALDALSDTVESGN